MNRRRINGGLACLIAGAAILAVPAGAQTTGSTKPAPPAPAPALEPGALERLKAMGDLLKGASAFTFTAKTVREQRGEGGQMLDFFSTSRVAIARPNRARVDTEGDLHNASLWYDGKTVTIFSNKSTFYAQAEAPPTIDEAIQMLVDRFEAPLPTGGFLLKDPYARMIDGVKSAIAFGVVKIDGVPCHHLVLSEDAADWQIWIEDGPRPLPRRLAVIYKKTEGAPRVVTALSDWNLSPAIPPGDFVFQAPAGAKKVDWKTVEK